jgi:hypothetical protein
MCYNTPAFESPRNLPKESEHLWLTKPEQVSPLSKHSFP